MVAIDLTSMPQPDDQREEALSRLDDRLKAFEADRAKKPAPFGGERQVGDGYRLLAELIGGVMCGLGLGWGFDQIAHTKPMGLIGGVLIGTGLSVFMMVRQASRMSAASSARGASEKAGPAKSAPFEEDEDDT